ncbi:HAD family hydrolase [Catenuloplanes japonicus]|uniref:HAD family hydrolase n=1 Tax=Catenuloplanes japonicus TaxID=33876 RepID=UPI000524A825|nr:HAD family hydrolase [Catenuloplanes japonicus]
MSTLVFDADDTLWENNILFIRVVDDFLAWLAHPTLDHAAIRAVLNDIERANVKVHGYGSRVFLRNLGDCFEKLNERPATEAERREIEQLAAALVFDRVELMPEVAETLADLGTRHELALLTKGEDAEQRRKLAASGLAGHFGSVHVVREKNLATYRGLTEAMALDPGATWMIGNSPKSDIIPARQAGWNAVFIPHPHTWELEHAALDPADTGVLELPSFTALRGRF